jgi:hypothetical protein
MHVLIELGYILEHTKGSNGAYRELSAFGGVCTFTLAHAELPVENDSSAGCARP